MNKFAKCLIKCGLLIAIIATSVGQNAKAQSLAYGLKVNIPFDFMVGNTKLPAGRYSVSRVYPNSGDDIIRITSLDKKAGAFRTTIPVTSTKYTNKGTLVFHRYGDQYFLFQVWPAGSSIGRTWPQSRGERDLQDKNRLSKGLPAIKERELEVVNIVADLP